MHLLHSKSASEIGRVNKPLRATALVYDVKRLIVNATGEKMRATSRIQAQ